jgi:hypothetical protein
MPLPLRLTIATLMLDIGTEWTLNRALLKSSGLEHIFAVPDTRPLSASDLAAANRRHDEQQASSPWFRLWQRYGVCCRTESPVARLGELES